MLEDFEDKKWLKTAQEIKDFRDKISKGNGGLCELSGEKLLRPCLDHDHITGQCRGVVSQHFNTYEGRVLKYWNKYCAKHTNLTLPEFLRRLADYYEKDWSDRPLHYRVVGDYSKKLRYTTKENIIKMLKDDFNITVAASTTKKDLIKIYCKNLKVFCERKREE